MKNWIRCYFYYFLSDVSVNYNVIFYLVANKFSFLLILICVSILVFWVIILLTVHSKRKNAEIVCNMRKYPLFSRKMHKSKIISVLGFIALCQLISFFIVLFRFNISNIDQLVQSLMYRCWMQYVCLCLISLFLF